MKHKLILLFLLVLGLCCNSCKDKLFDMDLHDVEVDGEWGLPVFNGSISLDQLLDKLDSIQYIQTGANGEVIIVFDQEATNLIKLSQLFKIEDQHFETSGTEPMGITPTIHMSIPRVVKPFSLSTEDVRLADGVVKSGTLSLDFSIQSINFQYDAVLKSGQILTNTGDSMSIHLSNSLQHQTINISDYTIRPNEEDSIIISAEVTFISPVQQDLNYTCELTLSDIQVKSLRGQFRAVQMDPLEESVGFSLPLDKINFNNIRLNNSHIAIYAKNSLCEFAGSIDELYLYNNQGQQVPFITNPLPVNCPISPIQYTASPITETTIASINYNPSLDSVKFKCNLTVNPQGFNAGEIYVDDNSSLDLKVKAELPADLSIDNAVYNDTMDNSLNGALAPSIIETIEKLTLRIAFTNAFPFDLVPSIDFLNSNTGEKFHVNLNGLQIHGAYGDIPYVQNPIFIEFTQEDAKKIANYDKIILNFHLNTQGHDVTIKTSQFIRAAIGAKITYSNIHF